MEALLLAGIKADLPSCASREDWLPTHGGRAELTALLVEQGHG
jgi:hypothetical protein